MRSISGGGSNPSDRCVRLLTVSRHTIRGQGALNLPKLLGENAAGAIQMRGWNQIRPAQCALDCLACSFQAPTFDLRINCLLQTVSMFRVDLQRLYRALEACGQPCRHSPSRRRSHLRKELATQGILRPQHAE